MEEQKPQEKIVSLSYVPRDYQIPVLDALENKGYKRVLAILPRRCLSGETHITLADGSYKKLKEIHPGDYILSWNGSTFVPDKVKNAWQTDTRLTVELRSYHYLGVTSSHEHSFAKTQPDSNIIDWSTVDQLCSSDHLLQYAGCIADAEGCNELSSLEAELYGYVISSLCSTMRNRISFVSTDRSLLERISDIIGQLYNLESSWRESRAVFTIFYTNRIDKQHELFDFLTFTQRMENHKGLFFAPSLWNLSKNNLQTILYILCSIDGELLSNGILLNLTDYLNYKWQFYWLFRKIGIAPFVPVCKIDHFELFLPMDSEVRSLLTMGSFHGQEVMQEYLLKHPYISREITKGCYSVPFLLFPSEPEQLYDLETETYGNFLANGYLVHNSGKDITAFNLAIRQCLRKPCVVYYIFPTYAQAKKVIWDSITNEGKRILDFIPPEVIANSNSQEMKIRFINGSLLQLIGSDNIDAIVGTNPQACIFSEYALQDPRAYQFMRPILTANDGWALFLSCVVGNTLVLTRHGLQRICDISSSRSEYTPLNLDIYGLGGFHPASDFYYGGWQPTLRITTSLGTLIECTPIHKLYTGTKWKAAQDLTVGDALPIQCGQNIYGDGIRITFAGSSPTAGCFARTPFLNELMYFFGIFQAHGIMEDNSITIHVLDPEILSFLKSLGFTNHHYQRDFVFHCPVLCALMESLGFNNSKTFPTALYQCTKEELVYFMRGFFDVATVFVKHNLSYVHALSSSIQFLRSLQTILFNFGIISRVEKKISYQLSIHPLSLSRFYYDIGFGLERKQAHRSLLIPPYDDTNPHITTDSLGNHYHTVLIDKILPSHAEVYDFVIPDTHSFFSNGLISHNTPRGKNHLWDLYQIAKQSPLWFCYKQTVEDTKHISFEAIEQERLEGIMSEDLIQQEYYTSFTMGVEGAYYLKYFDKLRLNNQIGNVAWEPSFPVNTSWDLGVRDSTAIIFYQVVGQAIHIIDCYENTKEGLEHYIKVLKEKPYQYGKHTAPHDIRVREFSSGITRLDKARHLGINFIIAPNIPVMDGIEQVRTILPRCWFDQTKCAQLIKSLENYRQEYDNKRKVYHNQPLHDQWSNFADSMRYLALTLPKTKDTTSAQELEHRYRSAMYGEENLPDFFR